jgi:hemolysin activation/secretion protein
LFQNMTGSIFYDYGEIDQYHDTTNLSVNQNNYSISGYGIGFESNIDERFSFKASYAKTLGGNPGEVSKKDSDGKADNSRFLFNISMKF